MNSATLIHVNYLNSDFVSVRNTRMNCTAVVLLKATGLWWFFIPPDMLLYVCIHRKVTTRSTPYNLALLCVYVFMRQRQGVLNKFNIRLNIY